MADPQQSGFDINAARQAGYSDDEILSHLVQSRNFDVNSALSSGYSKGDIINYLSNSRPDLSINPPPAAGPHVEMQNATFAQDYTMEDPATLDRNFRRDPNSFGVSDADRGASASDLNKELLKEGAAGLAGLAGPGMSRPLQAAILGTSGAAETKLSGGSNTSAAISGGVGAGLPFLGPLVGKVASRYVPSFLRSSAGAAFNAASDAAGASPVNVEGAGQAVLDAKELQDVGRTMPRTMQRFIQRVTAPDAAPLTYDEARRFYSAASELSANEQNNLTPAMQRLLQQYKSQLGQAIQQTADNAGVGRQYGQAMSDYAKAGRISDTWDTVWAATKKNLVPALIKGFGGGAGVAAAYGTYRSLTK